ncbi:MAG: acyl carrier protein [Bacteroidia bacterium]|jgi:acyl carrier protein
MSPQEIKNALDQTIEAHCQETGQAFSPALLDSNPNLIESGMFDSLAFLQFIATLEEKLGKEFDMLDEDPEVFTTYKGLLQMISK